MIQMFFVFLWLLSASVYMIMYAYTFHSAPKFEKKCNFKNTSFAISKNQFFAPQKSLKLPKVFFALLKLHLFSNFRALCVLSY